MNTIECFKYSTILLFCFLLKHKSDDSCLKTNVTTLDFKVCVFWTSPASQKVFKMFSASRKMLSKLISFKQDWSDKNLQSRPIPLQDEGLAQQVRTGHKCHGSVLRPGKAPRRSCLFHFLRHRFEAIVVLREVSPEDTISPCLCQNSVRDVFFLLNGLFNVLHYLPFIQFNFVGRKKLTDINCVFCRQEAWVFQRSRVWEQVFQCKQKPNLKVLNGGLWRHTVHEMKLFFMMVGSKDGPEWILNE